MKTTCRALITLCILALAQSSAITNAKDVEFQPLAAEAIRIAETLDRLGEPLAPAERDSLLQATRCTDPANGAERIQSLLDKHCLLMVAINPESRVKATRGPAAAELVESGYRSFLVKVTNDAGVTSLLNVQSPNARMLANSEAQDLPHEWLQMVRNPKEPLEPALDGLAVEYRILTLYSRDAGKREAKFRFDVGKGSQDVGFRSEADVVFTCLPSHDVTLRVLDESGKPSAAAFTIRDAGGRFYPSQAKRLAPDLFFHPQVYRLDGETVKLPAGKYTFEVTRGPEYLSQTREVVVLDAPAQDQRFELKRWVDPSLTHWYSGDHHIHAAGCSHYTKPTEGVRPEDMMRQCLGEDVKVGCTLTWGPCFDFQKQFFTGAIDKVSRYPYLLRYDVEVSGFGSHQSGHLVLLRLKEQIPPGGDSDKHWPTLCLNTLRWAKKQGAVCGPAHSGWGLEVKTRELPNFEAAPYSGIGANEYVVDVTHEVPGREGKPVPAVDFMSMVDTPYVWELNMWYHTLNCGYRTRISGETDFPCIYDERVGLGRSYVKLDGKLDFDQWCEGIRLGRCYVSDGRSHLMDFRANNVAVGENGSELRLSRGERVHMTARVAARLNETPDAALRSRPYSEKPYWNLERAREGDSRQVPVELIVNGRPVARQMITADGKEQDIAFDAPIDRSSWVAMRILPSSHTNPVFIVVDGKPIRASRKSAEWCLKGVDQCWSQKQRFIATAEMDEAKQAYEHAREAYREILAQCDPQLEP